MWFVGNLEHQSFPWMIDDLTQRFFTAANVTVDTYAAYPQFMLFNESAYTFVPLTEENAAQSVVGTEEGPSLSESMENFATSFGNILIRLINFVRSVIEGIVAHAKGTA